MVNLELSPDEAAMLRDVLKSYLSDLHTEIAHTDSRDFRAGLKKVEAFLKAQVERLEDGSQPTGR